MQIAETDLDDRQPIDELHESSAILIERATGKQQQRREGQCQRIVREQIRHSGDRTGEEQCHQPERIGVAARGPVRDFRISGIARFGSQDSPGGATYALFQLPTAQRAIAQPGKVDAVVVAGQPGISQTELRNRIQGAMPSGIQVLTGADITKENQDARSEERRVGKECRSRWSPYH